MNNNRFFARGIMTLFLMTALAAVMALPAGATPIHPTAEQLLRQAEQPVMPYVPAQVGWQEPAADRQDISEDARLGAVSFNASEILRDAEAARLRRALLLQIARPDPRVLLAFAAIIFLLRKMRTLRHNAAIPAPVQATSHWPCFSGGRIMASEKSDNSARAA